MMKHIVFFKRIGVVSMLLAAALTAVARPVDNSNVMAAPTVPVDADGLYTVEYCPTDHAALTVELHEGEYSIDQVIVKKNGKLLQAIPVSEDDDITRHVVHFLDANFDGNVDILVGPGCNREYSALFLWNPEENKFERATVDGFGVFNGDFYYEPERMAVYRHTSSSAFETTCTLMVWQGTDLKSEELFIQVSDESRYNDYGVTHHYTVRNYYSDEDAISTDDPTAIDDPWNKWLILLSED